VIRYTVGDCVLGHVLIAATDRGVCALSFGSESDGMDAWLPEEFPGAELVRDDVRLAGWLDDVRGLLDGSDAEIPLDSQGTAFQHRVWAELRTIPRGETRTYRDVAVALGVPGSVRAVARACATNPVSLIVPCHRVVGSDGSLRGYRWGVGRKRDLLDRERKKNPAPTPAKC
jgi:AraC family transcriptional regulator of adaptative response/methylated-DNA-[protein]-cysteine methyltransferase